MNKLSSDLDTQEQIINRSITNNRKWFFALKWDFKPKETKVESNEVKKYKQELFEKEQEAKNKYLSSNSSTNGSSI